MNLALKAYECRVRYADQDTTKTYVPSSNEYTRG